MTDPKPRRWFQLHLSTCIVLMLVAGGMLFLNLRPRSDAHQYACLSDVQYYQDLSYGWPGSFLTTFYEDKALIHQLQRWRPFAVFVDAAVIGLLLAVVAALCEFLARRRAAPNPKDQ